MKKRLMSGVLLLVILLCTGCVNHGEVVRITIPAGNLGDMVWSDTEISPRGHGIVLSCGEGLEDCAVNLLPAQARDENARDEAQYLAPGLSVKMNAEKNNWFRVGVSVWNETDHDLQVYVHAENVDVRIP